MFIQAATGIGKTMAVLFPAVKTIADGGTAKIFYLTARTTGRLAAEKALDELRTRGLRLKSLTLTAKEKICFTPDGACNPEECDYARGHFDRLPEARRAMFQDDAWTREAVSAAARRFRVCPFEFSLDLSLWADAVIGDYNYAFDPQAYLRRFFLEETAAYTFLVDEAHNLVERAREMFSAELGKQPVLGLRRAVKDALPALYRRLGRINRWMLAARKRCEEARSTDRRPRTARGTPAPAAGVSAGRRAVARKKREIPVPGGAPGVLFRGGQLSAGGRPVRRGLRHLHRGAPARPAAQALLHRPLPADRGGDQPLPIGRVLLRDPRTDGLLQDDAGL